jgi:hypothetical protein
MLGMYAGAPRQTWRQLPAERLVNYAHVDHAAQKLGPLLVENRETLNGSC